MMDLYAQLGLVLALWLSPFVLLAMCVRTIRRDRRDWERRERLRESARRDHTGGAT